MQFTLGNYVLLLKGHAAILDEDDEDIRIAHDEEVTVQCPSVLGLSKEYTEFGRGRGKLRLSHVCGKI